MSFTTKKVKSQTLGEFLRACRDRSGLSLSDIAKFSQVQPKNILALEEGRYEDLPDAVYVKGFLRSLSQVFHVPLGKLLLQYAAEQEIAEHIEKVQTESKIGSFSTPKFVFSSKTLVIAGLALFGFLSMSYLYFQVSSLKRPPRLEIFSPKTDLTTGGAVLLVHGTTEPGSSVYLNDQMIVVDAKGEFRENLSLAPGTNLLTIRAVNKFDKSNSASRTIVYQEKEIAGTATGTSQFVGEEKLTLEVLTNEQAAWIYLESDGVEKYVGTMLPHSRQSIAALEKIVLTTGNAGTTRVILNGKDLGILGKDGEVIRDIEFTR